MGTAVDFPLIFQGYYDSIDGSAQPQIDPNTSTILSRFLAGTISYPFAVELKIDDLAGGKFKVETAVKSLIPNIFSFSQTRGFVDEFEVSYARDGVNFARIFEIYPRLGSQIEFLVSDYQGFVTTKASIFDYFQSLIASSDPAKALQLDFPGDSLDTAFALGRWGFGGDVVPGQVFDLSGNEDKDFYSFDIDSENWEIRLNPIILAGSGEMKLQLYSGGVLIKEVHGPVVGMKLDLTDLAAGPYSLGLSADAGSSIQYNLGFARLEPSPLALGAATCQLLYACYYGRPADVPGFEFWKGKIQEAGLSYSPRAGDGLTDAELPLYQQIVDDFGRGPEYESLFAGKNNTQKMDAVYRYCFGRDSEIDPVTGENYWVSKIDRREITLAQAAVEVALGAQAGDLTFLARRIASADIFFQQLNTPQEQSAYAGAVAGGLALHWLQTFGATSATPDQADAVIAQIVAAANPL